MPATGGEVISLPENLQGARVLLVEDNDFNQEVATELLKEVGLKVEVAEHGAIALEKLRAAPDGTFDLQPGLLQELGRDSWLKSLSSTRSTRAPCRFSGRVTTSSLAA